MRASKKRAVRPQAKSLRQRFLDAEVTLEELTEIKSYCRRKRVSVSQFVADLLLEDADHSEGTRKQRVILKPEIELTPQQHDKLEVLARLHQKKSIGEYILDVLEPQLELQRLHVPVKTKILRFYLSDDEHKRISKHLSETGVSPSSYAAMLTLRAVRTDSTKRSK